MARMNRTGAATRAKILDAAIHVLATQGFSALTLRAVAAHADIVYGNLTHHYASRELLVEAVFEALVQRYRLAFKDMVAEVKEGTSPVRTMVTWLLDDAVSAPTAPVFLQLWSMAAHMPPIAEGMAQLYDGAVDAFFEAFGVDPLSPAAHQLRTRLYLLGTVIEGSSAIFGTRDDSGRAFGQVKALAIDLLVDLIERGIENARSDPR